MSSSNQRDSLRRFGTACLALLVAACQPSMDEVVARHRDAVGKVFTQIQALYAAVDAAPPPSEDGFDAAARGAVLDGDDSNALFLRAEDMPAPDHATSDGPGGTRAAAVQACGEAVRGEFAGVPAGAESYLAQCERAKYVFVLRTQVHDAPGMVGDKSFVAGTYAGDVLLFRLADGAPLGGFRVDAASHGSVQALADENGNPIDASGRLDSDLNANAFVGIEEKLKKLLPGSVK
jgi:hypothetical protein